VIITAFYGAGVFMGSERLRLTEMRFQQFLPLLAPARDAIIGS